MTEERTVTEAIDLAEQLLDEVTRAEPRWQAVEHLADALGRLAGGAAARADTVDSGRRDTTGA